MSTITRIRTVDSSLIKFGKPEDPNEHPFDTAKLLIEPSNTLSALQEAAELLKNTNDPVAFPTETVYGLGADARRTDAVYSIYKAKNRPADNPLIVHIASLDQLRRLISKGQPLKSKDSDLPDSSLIPQIYKPLIDRFWPGPLSIILPVKNNEHPPVSPIVTANQPTFAVRMPQHPVALALMALSDVPLAAPSANASTRPSPTQAKHVYNDLQGKIPLILDGGSCGVGLESTVVNGLCYPPVILRPGGVSLEQIRDCGGVWVNTQVYKPTAVNTEKNFIPQTPGMKYRHYSPTAKVMLFLDYKEREAMDCLYDQLRQKNMDKDEARIGVLCSRKWKKEVFGEFSNLTFLDLGEEGSEITKNLFAHLRELDLKGVDFVLVEGVAEDNEGLAIMNRLSKAASMVFTKDSPS
ncbi:mitochondrial tRNA N6-threonyl-carbamoyl-adenosine (t6A) Sua5 [Schizosaccharomyces osmophilus]|uniref:Threonylcarbamoyl-AMP synthase n=1 Tax=Schizosaccharomyces osmophilus TaxID=2545709 RepID=A0AAE9WDQ7_9SCHI|nr:mitochondrial tRNA N6-threonyl-carbamoyl-adenosine (t6A) Sua5 [Schizosaccharomyces osmophilus]WBW73332.1 mitochondrial tRNA N6-threonyl-carbamoyl-adenosine (t6A) Sua5 [Schizosaccharomyces osmophilus]